MIPRLCQYRGSGDRPAPDQATAPTRVFYRPSFQPPVRTPLAMVGFDRPHPAQTDRQFKSGTCRRSCPNGKLEGTWPTRASHPLDFDHFRRHDVSIWECCLHQGRAYVHRVNRCAAHLDRVRCRIKNCFICTVQGPVQAAAATITTGKRLGEPIDAASAWSNGLNYPPDTAGL